MTKHTLHIGTAHTCTQVYTFLCAVSQCTMSKINVLQPKNERLLLESINDIFGSDTSYNFKHLLTQTLNIFKSSVCMLLFQELTISCLFRTQRSKSVTIFAITLPVSLLQCYETSVMLRWQNMDDLGFSMSYCKRL